MHLLLLASTAFATPFDRENIAPTVFPTAVCNDGTIPIFYLYLAPSGSVNADKWILDFDGDGEPCADAAECAAQLPQEYATMGTGCMANSAGVVTCDLNVGSWSMTAGAPWPVVQDLGGIFSDDPVVNPGFYDWNKAQIVSCSSDLWAGDGGVISLAAAGGFPSIHGADIVTFDGSGIAGAVFFTLAMDYGLMGADKVVLTGSGTGASGVYNHLDRLLGYFPPHTDGSPRAVGVVDSGATRLLTDAWDSSSLNDDPAAPDTSFGCRARGSSGVLPSTTWYNTAYVNWYGHGMDDSCRASAAAMGMTPGLCLFPDFLHVTDEVESPFFVRQDFTDMDGVLAMDDALGAAPAYADDVACFVQTQHNRGLAVQRASALGGYFMPCEGEHIGLEEDGPFATTTANGHTFGELLDNFVNGAAPNTRAAEAGCLVYPNIP